VVGVELVAVEQHRRGQSAALRNLLRECQSVEGSPTTFSVETDESR